MSGFKVARSHLAHRNRRIVTICSNIHKLPAKLRPVPDRIDQQLIHLFRGRGRSNDLGAAHQLVAVAMIAVGVRVHEREF